jgi:hypothetical protein
MIVPTGKINRWGGDIAQCISNKATPPNSATPCRKAFRDMNLWGPFLLKTTTHRILENNKSLSVK